MLSLHIANNSISPSAPLFLRAPPSACARRSYYAGHLLPFSPRTKDSRVSPDEAAPQVSEERIFGEETTANLKDYK
ncbi:unnamed protein product [Menidia menidia]|uniref:(Atlantic silverside) hypothetical protein n=1 Tax=Menidia menidia TaxID=238744 RepID=A0A8S4AXI1_9TELE|nr:unnamed protein product [Menidia menidia]